MSLENCHLDALARCLPISILTGFLGSGKTTVLNHLLQQPALKRTLILINEFGEIGLDHDLVTHSLEEGIIIEMASGCLCCTIRGDLTKTLREAPGRFARGGKLWFDRVIIETTGLADPAPILHTLMSEPTLTRYYRLDGVIATVDAVNGNDSLDRQVESVKQAAVADRLLITKVDLVDSARLHALQRRLQHLNPAALQTITENGVVDPASLFDVGLYDPTRKSLDVQNWLKAEAYAKQHQGAAGHDHHHHQHDINRHDDHIKAFCLTIDEPLPPTLLELWLEALLRFRGADFLRVKGIINVVDIPNPIVIHAVQHIFHPPLMLDAWPSDDRRSKIVFITRDIDESLLRESYNDALKRLDYTAPDRL